MYGANVTLQWEWGKYFEHLLTVPSHYIKTVGKKDAMKISRLQKLRALVHHCFLHENLGRESGFFTKSI